MKTVVVGLGNPVLSDDAVGWAVLARLRERIGPRAGLDFEESSRGGLALMERLVGYDRAVIVDAARTGADPGTLHRLGPGDLPTANSASSHDVTLPAALEVGRRAGVHLPADDSVFLVAIEAADTSTFSERCTPAVEAAIPRAVAAVEELLFREG